MKIMTTLRCTLLTLGILCFGYGNAQGTRSSGGRLVMNRLNVTTSGYGNAQGIRSSDGRLVMNRLNVTTPKLGPVEGLQEPQRYSGYFKLNRTYDAHMFFFYFSARNAPETAPVVLWMTGGPGCSSELAVFFENGPFTITKDLELEETEYGWDVNSHMIYVDQPINTGFSYSEDDRDRCYDEVCVANDMLDFLVEFFKSLPELADRPFFVTGESYAGHYVPAVASRVFLANAGKELFRPINLKGLAIGNGLTVPRVQYGAYADFAYMHKLIGKSVHDRIMFLYPACRLALDVCQGLSWRLECLLAVDFCQATMFAPILIENPEINVYDIRKKCVGPLCYDFSRMEEYLNLPEVRKKLGVGDRKWEACSMSVHQDMMGDWGHAFSNVLPAMLEAGIRVMVYAGDQDLICNWLGNRRWVDQLNWYGMDDWIRAEEETWSVDGEEAGTVTQAGPLSFVKVFGAGHMVPMDKPKNALDMITAFTKGSPLGTSASAGSAARAKLLPGVTWTLRGAGRKEGPAAMQAAAQ